MARFALLLEYDGTPFVGWQRQGQGVSVQHVLETAAARLASGAAVACTAAGRTDSGVHAQGQVAHLDLVAPITQAALRDGLNFHMRPHPIAVVQASLVADDWHARFTAIGRGYRYRILNRRARPALLRDQVWHVNRILDAAAMQDAAQALLGRHDFTSFRATSCQAASPVRTLDRITVARDGDIIEIAVAARSFLHHQVRNITGTLKLVGDGKWPVSRVAEALTARDRRAAGPTAPAAGLCLTKVQYPDNPFSEADEVKPTR